MVTCLRPLDGGSPKLAVALGRLVGPRLTGTGLVFVWFLEDQQYGVVFDWTDVRLDDISDTSEDDHRNEDYKTRLVSNDIEFSMAILDGQYHLGDGRDPETELRIQEDQDITFALIPFAFKGFTVEDACRYKGVIQPMTKEVLIKAVTKLDE